MLFVCEMKINFTYFRDDKFSFNYDNKFEKICKVSRLSINRNENKPTIDVQKEERKVSYDDGGGSKKKYMTYR